MLTAADLAQGRTARRSPPSLKQQYQDYQLQRIEAFKNTLSRAELLALGDEASIELQSGAAGQFVLTEVLMLETVDRLIMKRLGIPPYKKWRKQFHAIRLAQREPVHWGLDPASALVALLPRLEPEDSVLVIGGGIQAEACLLLAYDAAVTFVDDDRSAVDQLEARLNSESLASRLLTYVSNLGGWLPAFPSPVPLVVVDAGTLAALPYVQRQALLTQAQELTVPGGVHAILPGDSSAAPEAYLSHYAHWKRERPDSAREGKAARSHGVIVGRPVEPAPEPTRMAARG